MGRATQVSPLLELHCQHRLAGDPVGGAVAVDDEPVAADALERAGDLGAVGGEVIAREGVGRLSGDAHRLAAEVYTAPPAGGRPDGVFLRSLRTGRNLGRCPLAPLVRNS